MIKEWYIKSKAAKILNFGQKKKVHDLERAHQIGRYINRMNGVIQESILELEKHLIANARQIAKEEFK